MYVYCMCIVCVSVCVCVCELHYLYFSIETLYCDHVPRIRAAKGTGHHVERREMLTMYA